MRRLMHWLNNPAPAPKLEQRDGESNYDFHAREFDALMAI